MKHEVEEWKGEHLIRAPEKKGPAEHHCRKCGKELSDANVTGYCKDHRHLGRRYGGRRAGMF